ncbi:response regulator transcription factor [Streptomyces griseorubiginosus]|uniref:response regulator transcription factor n=1 Tax=Streptomyces griseorubiginosus TaxID=67304 RepID=UPI003F53CF31
MADSLRHGLARYGYPVTWVATGRDALAAPVTDLVLLDLGLPDIDGLDVCRELRARGDVPIVILSGRGSETEKVVGLELGADDYLVKPFLTRELIARMRAVLRRRPTAPACCHLPPRDTYGRLSVDRRAHRAFLDDVEVPLSPKEFALLAFLTERIPCDRPAPQARRRAPYPGGTRGRFPTGPRARRPRIRRARRRRRTGAPLVLSARGAGSPPTGADGWCA